MKNTFFIKSISEKNLLTKQELTSIKGQRDPNDPRNICLARCIELGGTQEYCIGECY